MVFVWLRFLLEMIRLILFGFHISFISSVRDGPIVQLENGRVRGIFLESRDGRIYNAFMGIPYAEQPPRFEEPKPSLPWTGDWDATKFGSVCSQLDIRGQSYVGSENCLFINVFTPNVSGEMSVLAFIHGGGFQFGNSDENGADYIMDEDVVFVTFNYRVGPLGFLSMSDEVLPGNYGMKDQVLALEWIQQNIKEFGGNPKKVTLFGESAGGASVSLHTLSPLSKGLFNNAICISGSSLDRWAVAENPAVNSEVFADRIGCPSETSAQLKKCLTSKSPEELFVPEKDPSLPFFTPIFVPVVEPEGIPHAFLTEKPTELYAKGAFAHLPLLFTVNEDEGLLINSAAIMINPQLKQMVNENWLKIAPSLFYYGNKKRTEDENKKISELLLSFYFDNKLPASEETFQNLTNIFSDSGFIRGTRETIFAHAKYAPTYAGILAFRGIWSQIFALGYDRVLGLAHADDLPFLFTNERYPKFLPGSDALYASKSLIKRFVKFANLGNLDGDVNDATWEPVSLAEIESGDLAWMYLYNTRFEKQVSPLLNRMKFWDQIYSNQLEPTLKSEL